MSRFVIQSRVKGFAIHAPDFGYAFHLSGAEILEHLALEINRLN